MKKAAPLKLLAKDLKKEFPRSPRFVLGGYVIAGRTLDKCRATVAGTAGDYHFNCPLDQILFGFTEIDSAQFKKFVATGASDDEVGAWIARNAKKRKRIEIIRWNNSWRDKRIVDLTDDFQEYLEDYVPKFIPRNRVPYTYFDVYDIEEQRI